MLLIFLDGEVVREEIQVNNDNNNKRAEQSKREVKRAKRITV